MESDLKFCPSQASPVSRAQYPHVTSDSPSDGADGEKVFTVAGSPAGQRWLDREPLWGELLRGLVAASLPRRTANGAALAA